MSAVLSPRLVFRLLVTVITVLVFLHAAGLVAQFGFGDPRFLELRALFDLNLEQNIPTLFSTLQLMLASLLLAIVFAVARRDRNPDRYYWAGLSLLFAFLGADEFCEWHERLMVPMRHAFHATGALYFAWVIPYSALVLLFAAGYARFWWRLPAPTRWRFTAAGVIYVGGGIVLEMVGSKIEQTSGWESLLYNVETMAEEAMEMGGVALFVYAILGYLQQRVGVLRIELRDDRGVVDELQQDAAPGELQDRLPLDDRLDLAA